MLDRKALVNLTVAVAALGYFVDTFDIIIFSVVRVQSLTDLGVAPEDLLTVGHNILNWQMAGMLLGALLLGPLGDLKGRRAVLLGSILLYSTATLASGFVQDVTTYTILRFIAGAGLAAEIGAAVTLTAEILPQTKRGYGPMFIAVGGFLGGISAGLAGEAMPWRYTYVLGGLMGFLLLFLRTKTIESELFTQMADRKQTGFYQLKAFFDRKHGGRFVACVLSGITIWFTMGILLVGAPEISKQAGLLTPVTTGTGVMVFYLGATLGDLLTIGISQMLKRRRIVLQAFIVTFMIGLTVFCTFPPQTAEGFYGWLFAFGAICGYWVLLMTVTAESYGTNLRTTVSALVPNVIRASVIPITFIFGLLKPVTTTLDASLILGLGCAVVALLATFILPETFHRRLNYETKSGKD